MDDVQSKIVDAYKIATSGNFDHARLILEETLYDHPKHIEAWLLLADLAVNAEEARQCYQMVLEIAPDNWVAQQRMKILFENSPTGEEFENTSLFLDDDEEEGEEKEEAQPFSKDPLIAPDVFDELMIDDFKRNYKPTLKESFNAHKKLIMGIGAGIVAVFILGVIAWIASVGFIVWKTGFLAWFGF